MNLKSFFLFFLLLFGADGGGFARRETHVSLDLLFFIKFVSWASHTSSLYSHKRLAKHKSMSSNFKVVQEVDVNGHKITKFRSTKTGLSVVHVDNEGADTIRMPFFQHDVANVKRGGYRN